ncbi:hypothetical protein PFUGPA_04388 [Plasmodium falciparum Palo Alto/Uganda]|uniref:Uncharacterized protein n=1 Tax=Plasmodium falciparum (isolate Palo Alto / Uganda) TaxID=57270 RepID=W4ITP4_PLAFP|nr:hypothetical protein PFUGPA_04388 [Plasmodium falciparum Palo Alto/Uganda]
MIRLIFLFIIDFFIGVIIINVFFFEYVKCQGKFVNTKKEFPKIKNISNTFKQIKFFAPSKKKKRNYLFLSKHNFKKNNDNGISSSNKKKNFLLKYQTRNNVMYRIICNHNLLILNNTSFLKPTKLTIYNHDAPKNDLSANDPEKGGRKSKALPTNNLNDKKEENVLPTNNLNDKKEENVLPIDKANDQNDNVTLPVNNLNEDQTNNLSLKKNEETKNKDISENNDTWKKYLEDKRKKEILKDLENKRNKNNNCNNNNIKKKKKNYNNEYMKNIKKYTYNNNNNNNNNNSNSNTCDIIQKNELSGNDEIIKDQSNYSNDHNNDYYEDDDNDYYEDDDNDYYEDDDDDYYEDDDDDYDNDYDNDNDNDFIDEYSDLEKQERQYDNLQNGKFPYFNNINDTNKNLRNQKTYNEEKKNNNNNSSSLNDSINNIFSSNKKNDLPLFFSLNNKSFENSNNKYFDKICSISPNELINRFFENTSERVKEAVKNIIFNIIGNIQKYTIETSILITYEKIYNFLLQIILTGYMIKNADYRLTLNESLYDQNNILNKKDYDQQEDEQEDVNKQKQQNNQYQEDDLFNLKKSFHTLFSDNNINNISEEQLNKGEMLNSKHIINPNGTTTTTNNNNIDNNNIDNYQRNGESDDTTNDITNDTTNETANGTTNNITNNITNDDYPIINTKNYILFLRKKINSLEKQLNILKESKTFLNDDLLSYIKSLTEIQLRSLTDNIGPLVLDSTKKIVELVIQGMTLNINKNMSNELIYVSGSVLTYICFWQLIIGYTLREMEIRDELSDYLKGS